jgi:signal transduction histidine kinase
MRSTLYESDPIESMSLTLAGAIHDLNNQIMCAMANLDLADRILCVDSGSHPLQEPLLVRLRAARKGIDRIRAIAGDMRLLVHPPREKTAVSLESVLESALFASIGAVRIRARVRKTWASTSPVWASAQRLEQVFLNLMLNACHAMQDREDGDNMLHLSTASDGEDFVVASVRDTGIGIPSDVQARIFRPFVTTKDGGTGLGLFVCDRIVRSFGGSISFSSEAGVGTEFRVRLPVHRTQAHERSIEPSARSVSAASEVASTAE